MSASGESYASVDASVVNSGIMPLAISGDTGDPTGGETQVPVTIHWMFDGEIQKSGITGVGWFDTDPVSPFYNKGLTTEGAVHNKLIDIYTKNKNEEEVKQYVDSVMAEWAANDKGAFLEKYLSTVGTTYEGGCVSFT